GNNETLSITNLTEIILKPIETPSSNGSDGNSTTPQPVPADSFNKDTSILSKPVLEHENNSVDAKEFAGSARPPEANKEDLPELDDNSTVTIATVIPIVVVFGIVPILLTALWLLKKRSK
ncbi:unnamed protein product, partial [Allacma fusca]